MMTTTPHTNHGKKWTPTEDEQLTACHCHTDIALAEIMSRSESAVKSRRAVLAAKLHMGNATLSIQECALMMGADVARTTVAVRKYNKTTKVVASKDTEENKPKSIIIATAKKAATPKSVTYSTRTSLDSAKSSDAAKPGFPSTTVRTICDYIKRNNGKTTEIWKQDALVPTLIQFHAGFQAYAAYVTKESLTS
jgi:hypothetical protein